MKRLLLGLTGALAMSVSAPAEAALFVNFQEGVTSVSCNNSTAAGVTACTAAGFNTSLNSNSVSYSGAVGSYNLQLFGLGANVPGTEDAAFSAATELLVTNNVAGNSLSITFAAFDFTAPTGPFMSLSASQTANYTASTLGDSVAFTGYARADNGITPGGTAATTPLIVSPGGNTVPAPSESGEYEWTRLATPFSLLGVATISQAVGTAAQYTQTVTTTAVPEPTSLILLGTGLLGVARSVRRRRMQTA